MVSQIVSYRWAVLAAAILVAAGCGDSGPPTAKVTGTVTAGGKPITNATVLFSIKQGGSGSGTTDDQGKYSALVPLGDAKVAVLPAPAAARSPIYNKYNVTSTSVTFAVKSGSNECNIDMK
jgi:hypothetical protein